MGCLLTFEFKSLNPKVVNRLGIWISSIVYYHFLFNYRSPICEWLLFSKGTICELPPFSKSTISEWPPFSKLTICEWPPFSKSTICQRNHQYAKNRSDLEINNVTMTTVLEDKNQWKHFTIENQQRVTDFTYKILWLTVIWNMKNSHKYNSVSNSQHLK